MTTNDWSSDDDSNDSKEDSDAEDGSPSSDSSDFSEVENEVDDLHKDVPLQLITLTNQTGESNSNFKVNLNQENFDTILQSTEERPLCIISVVGPPRQGKSLLLNYIKLTLEALENSDDTFDISVINHPVTGFTWNSRYDPVTKGIWAWSRAFLIDSSDKEIAVILLDSQGFSNETMTAPHLSSLLGLSFLYSSILIYNLPNDISIDNMKPLLPFFNFGLSCKEIDEECTDEPPFQKISFLIRDWSNPAKFAYGAEGGKLFLKQKVKSLPSSIKKITQNSFKRSFSKVEAFLMPSIGQSGFTEGFSGQTTELDPEFILQLKTYINNLLSQRNLLTHRVLSNDVTSTEFEIYIQQYVKLFNTNALNNRVTSPEDIFKVRCESMHQNVLAKSMKKFQELLERKQKSSRYLTETELSETKKIGKKQANSVFERTKKLSEFAAEYTKRLDQGLESYFQAFQENNAVARSTFVAESVGVAQEAYRKEISDKVTFTDNQVTIYEEEDIQDISQQAFSSVSAVFTTTFQNEDKQVIQGLIGSLKQVLTSTLKPFLERNNQNKEKAKDGLLQLANKLVEDYRLTMQTLLLDIPYIDIMLLRQYHGINLKKAEKEFENSEKKGDTTTISHFGAYLNSELNRIYENFKESQTTKIEEKMNEGISILNTQAEAYRKVLKQQAQEVSTAEELTTLHSSALCNVIERFKPLNPFPEDSSQYEVLNTRLKDQLQLVFNLVTSEELDTKKKLEEKLRRESTRCCELYVVEIEAMKNGAEFVDECKLLEAHEQSLTNCLLSFDEAFQEDDPDVTNKYRSQLEKSIETKYIKFKTSNDTAVKLAKSQAKNWCSECLKEYTEAMRGPMTSCETKEDVRAEHQSVKMKSIESFNTKWCNAYNCNEFQEDFEKELANEINETFEELMEHFEIAKSSDQEKTNAARNETRQIYKEEMEKHLKNNQFIPPSILKSLHEKASHVALERCQEKTPLKETQKTILKQDLEKCFIKYDEENTMSLNYQLGSEPAIGIDLGTTYCCVAVFFKGTTVTIRNKEGKNITPSYIAFDQDGKHTIGYSAKENAFRNPENTVYDAKRIIGRTINDQQLQNDMEYWPFKVVDGAEGPAIEIMGKKYPPEQIAAMLLKELVVQAEEMLGVKLIRKAVITVPAYFTDGQRAATVDAGEMAGLEVLQILDEPTAAALAYKLERFHDAARNILIFDMGGGTFDISILKMTSGKITILNKAGDTHLGGEDFDKKMMEYCSDEFKRVHGVDPFEGKNSTQKQEKDAAKQRLRRLQTYCERGKIDLASVVSTVISVDAFYKDKDLKVTITRQQFEEMNDPYFKKALEIVDRSLKYLGLLTTQIDDIVLVGGSTRIPKVQEMLTEFFGGKALNHNVHPDEAVARGAAIQAALLNGTNAASELSFGSIDDVTPMSLGIEAIVDGVRGAFSPIIPKNTSIPTTHKEVYRTFKDNQESALVKIFQGESQVAIENNLLGEFTLRGIPPATAGRECIDIIMEINAMGVLNVRAVVKSTRGCEALEVNQSNSGRISRVTKQKLLAEVSI